ncbi:Alpha/Beta hydrolase protein [Crassisporium funariophilum]|nr:Alpha/Beta hydrolase protein [Crassisporium funariophilum]
MLRRSWLLLIADIALLQASAMAFNPSAYRKHTANCKAIRRAPTTEVVDLQLKYVDINPKASTTLLMVHGWPSLWSTWSKQIEEFQDDYHLIIPDLRGFGASTHPGDTRSSGTLGDMVGDLVCILQEANVGSAICMGHDWGSTVCYEAARLRPDIFKAMIGVVVPYIPSAGPFVAMKDLALVFPALTYQLFFDTLTDAAVAELDRDIRRTVRATLRTVDSPPPESFLKDKESFLAAWDEFEEIPPIPFFTPEEEDYFVDQYSLNGFRHTLQFYTHHNRFIGWELANSQGNHTIYQPVLAIYPTQDPVSNWVHVAKHLNSSDFLPNLTTKLLPGAHWVHLEHPSEFNELVREWLSATPWQDEKGHYKHVDEL